MNKSCFGFVFFSLFLIATALNFRVVHASDLALVPEEPKDKIRRSSTPNSSIWTVPDLIRRIAQHCANPKDILAVMRLNKTAYTALEDIHTEFWESMYIKHAEIFAHPTMISKDRGTIYPYKKEFIKHYITIAFHAQTDPASLQKMKEEYNIGQWDFPIDVMPLDPSKGLIEDLVLRGNQWAIAKKQEGLLYGKYGYEQDLKRIEAFLKELGEHSHQWVIAKEIPGFMFGKNGYEKDPQKARDLLEKLAAQGNTWATQEKLDGLQFGRYGYKMDPQKAKALLEELINNGNAWAIQKKLQGLHLGRYGYEKNKQAIQALLKQLSTNDLWVIQKKLDTYRNPDGGSHNARSVKEHIDRLEIEKIPIAIYLKSYFLRYGLYGYPQQDAATLKEYIIKHSIPYKWS